MTVYSHSQIAKTQNKVASFYFTLNVEMYLFIDRTAGTTNFAAPLTWFKSLMEN